MPFHRPAHARPACDFDSDSDGNFAPNSDRNVVTRFERNSASRLDRCPDQGLDEDALLRAAQQSEDDYYFMGLALEQARMAAKLDEVPIGAVVVCKGEVIAQGYNRREIDNNPAGHAEFLAMMEASRRLGVWRLSDCTVYVTLEPCLMCAGLMYQARIDRCVYGALDPKAGALGSLYHINEDERLNHAFAVTRGVRADESAALLRSFFKDKRARNKARKLF